MPAVVTISVSLAFLGAAGNFVLSGYILSQNPKLKLNRAASFFAFTAGCLAFILYSFIRSPNEVERKFWDGALFFIEPVLTFAFAWFAHVLTEKPKFLHGKKFYLWIGIPTLLTMLLYNGFWNAPASYNIIQFILRFSWFSFCFFFFLYFMYKTYRNTKLHYLRKQLKTTFIAIATGGSIAIMDFIVQTIYPLQNFSLTVIGIDITLATMAYAILKYNTATVVPSSVYSIIINSMDEALFLVDHDVIRFVNRAASLLSGYSETELLGKNLNTLIEYAKDIESSPEEQFFADNMINLNFLHKSGKKIPIYLSATTFRDSQSSNSVVCLVHDMTYYKKLVVKIYEAEKNLREKMNIIKKDMQIAKAVSSTFLPKKAPTIANIICDYRFQPLDEIGGDFFSFRELSEGGVGFFIGDVTGHGVAASLFLSMLRVITDQVCGMYGTNPKAYINELNARLNSIMQSNFVTGIYAHFDNRKKGNCIVRLARAGHPEPIVYKKADNKAYYLESRGALLGLRKETHTEEVQLTLQSRDRIFFYTDGIVEVTDESKTMLGEKRFLELFEENQDNNLSKTLDKIIEKVYEFSPTNQVNDDILLIGFEVV